MPIYEYTCKKCGHHLDVLQNLSDAPLKDCPACNTPNLEKQISAPMFQLKGTGWYETDFKGKKAKETVSTESSAANDSASSTKKDDTTKMPSTSSDKTE